MVMTVRQQMICIIAPDWRGGADLVASDHMSQALKAIFRDVEVVHFASIALLPAMSDAQSPLPSLMLELAVEEGLRPYDLLYRLVNHPSGAMWSLYGIYWPEGERPVGQRNQELLDRLMSWHSIADGAFVGARDRSVRQIKKERGLLRQTRETARQLKAEQGSDRATFALSLSRWAFEKPEFDWATEPAPRSFWRGSGASIIAKVAYPAAVVALWMASVWLVGAFFRLATSR